MAQYHTVKLGECISQIADRYGFFWETLWTHENNAGLRHDRENPNVLMPGDQVFIPDKRVKEESGATTQVHTFRLKGIPVYFKLRLLDSFGDPMDGVKYRLTIGGKSGAGITGEDGMISMPIPPGATRGVLKILNADECDLEPEYQLELGNLNPVTSASGLKARLRNLGYYTGAADENMDDETGAALRRFQKAEGLPITGEADEATRARLVERHGS